MKITANTSPSEDRLISLSAGLAAIPERLLLAHARGQVLFITGAGTSMSAGLPDFKGLVLSVFEELDSAVFSVLSTPASASGKHDDVVPGMPPLSDKQRAEVERFHRGDYDVVLGMLERRMDGNSGNGSKVRRAVSRLVRGAVASSSISAPLKPAPIHKALIRLANRGVATTIVTSNFDRLLQTADSRIRDLSTYALGGIPRPGRRGEFSGVMHIHGVIDKDPRKMTDVIVTDQDFGEFYLRRRIVPDFIYDAARLFHLVLVGYSANDAPMRYLLNAVAADGSRFDDLKERFAFVGLKGPY